MNKPRCSGSPNGSAGTSSPSSAWLCHVETWHESLKQATERASAFDQKRTNTHNYKHTYTTSSTSLPRLSCLVGWLCSNTNNPHYSKGQMRRSFSQRQQGFFSPHLSFSQKFVTDTRTSPSIQSQSVGCVYRQYMHAARPSTSNST